MVMNERQARENLIEMRVEKMVDRLDARFMRDNAEMSQEEYDAKMREIYEWAEEQYRLIR